MGDVAEARLVCGAASSFGPAWALCNNWTTVPLMLGSSNDFTFEVEGWSVSFDEDGGATVRCPSHSPGADPTVVVRPSAEEGLVSVSGGAATDTSGPWHIVSRVSGKFVGPFASEWDCAMARSIATPDWATGIDMDKARFDRWLSVQAGGGLHPESECGEDCSGCVSPGEGGY